MSEVPQDSPVHQAPFLNVPGGAGAPGSGTDLWLLAVVGCHVILALLLFEPTLFPGADASHYMVLGESLRHGLGFRDIQLPGAPLHAKFPPGYPLVLAVAGWFGGLQLFKAVSLVCTTGTVWLTYRIGRGVLGRVPALVAAALVGASPVLLDYSHRVLSEALFTFLLLLTVAASAEDRKWGVAALGAAVAAFFTRTAGLPVLLAVAAYPLMARQWHRAVPAALATVFAIGAWVVYQRLAQPSQPGYLEQLVLLNPYDPGAGTVGFADFPVRIARNLWRYISSEYPGSFGLPTERAGTVLVTGGTGILISGLGLAGWLWTATRRLTVAHLVTLLYIGLILLWPPVWTDRRFLLPVLPLLLIWTGGGVRALVGERRGRLGLVVGGLAVGVLATFAVSSAVRLVPNRLACQASYRTGVTCDRPNYEEFYAMGRWAAENTPPDAIIANRSPAAFFLFSRRQGDVYPYSRDPEVVFRGLEDMGADYVVVDRLSATTQMYLVPTIAAFLDRFIAVHVIGGEEGTMLLRILPIERTAMVPATP